MATNKSIQDLIFKSRLTIKYRTEISGTPVEAKLPFRLLVLGDFSGKSAHDGGFNGTLADRKVWSITKGMTPDQILRTLGYSVKVSRPELRSSFPGKLSFSLPFKVADLKLPSGADGAQSRPLKLDAYTEFASSKQDNGVADISKAGTYVVATLRFTAQSGAVVSFDGVKLSIRGRVSAEAIDDATQKVVGTVSGRIKFDTDPEIDLKGKDTTWSGTLPTGGTVTVSAGDGDNFTLSVDGLALDAERTIPIFEMDDLSPDSVAESLPELHRLFVIKQILAELKSTIMSRPDLRKKLSEALKAKDLKDVKELKQRLVTELPKLSIA